MPQEARFQGGFEFSKAPSSLVMIHMRFKITRVLGKILIIVLNSWTKSNQKSKRLGHLTLDIDYDLQGCIEFFLLEEMRYISFLLLKEKKMGENFHHLQSILPVGST